jgi:minor extracellular serine protease Vpr
VTVGGTTYGAASGDFATVAADLTAPLGVVTGTTKGLSTACSALAAGSLTGKIALISRGTCTFSTKIRNAQNAGAAAVLVTNNVAGDPVAMGQDGTPNQPTVPAYMVSKNDGQALCGQNGASTTIGATKQYFLTSNANIMAGFSSQARRTSTSASSRTSSLRA